MTKKESDELYLKSWDKISHWLKVNTAFPTPKRFRHFSTAHVWEDIVVTPDGESFLVNGDWSNTVKPDEVIHRRDMFTCCWDVRISKDFLKDLEEQASYHHDIAIAYESITNVVDNWQYVRVDIEREIDKQNRLARFEP